MPTPESLTIPDKLDSINVTKQAIRQAIVDKGVEVPEGTTFYEYAGKIASIETGGGEPTSVNLAIELSRSFLYELYVVLITEIGGSNAFGKQVLTSNGTTNIQVYSGDYIWIRYDSNNFGIDSISGAIESIYEKNIGYEKELLLKINESSSEALIKIYDPDL